MIKSVLITGANAGLGKEVARQMALQDGVEKIYLGCRNEAKAKAAKQDLEQATGKSIFEIILIDVSDLASVSSAVASLVEPIDALVMNAGGLGGKTSTQKNKNGVTNLFAVNVLGHTVLLDELLNANKLAQVAIYAGSEAARGVPMMGMKRPNLSTSSVDEFAAICDGSYFSDNVAPMTAYGPVKYVAAMWMAAIARKHPNIRFITVSPGGTGGTEFANDMPALMRFFFTQVGFRLMPLFGMMHKLEDGARRYVDVLTNESYKSGTFYASKESALTGPLVDQGTFFADLNNKVYQDNAYEAAHRFIN